MLFVLEYTSCRCSTLDVPKSERKNVIKKQFSSGWSSKMYEMNEIGISSCNNYFNFPSLERLFTFTIANVVIEHQQRGMSHVVFTNDNRRKHTNEGKMLSTLVIQIFLDLNFAQIEWQRRSLRVKKWERKIVI